MEIRGLPVPPGAPAVLSAGPAFPAQSSTRFSPRFGPTHWIFSGLHEDCCGRVVDQMQMSLMTYLPRI